MNAKPLVSVLMPLYNGEKYLQKAIDSIINQTYTNIELIILNDGSMDDSEYIVSLYKDERIRYEKNVANKGIVYTRNKLFQLARGEYWAIMDCDDFAYPDRIAKQLAYMQNTPECIICGSWAKKIDNTGRVMGLMQPPASYDNILINQLFQSSFLQSTVMLRATAMSEIYYSREFPVAEDFDLWTRLLEKGKGYNIPEYLLYYRYHTENISSLKNKLIEEKRNAIIARQLNKLGSFSGEEVRIVANLGGLEVNSDASFFSLAKNTLIKIQNLNNTICKYTRNNMSAMLAYRWIFYCIATKHYMQIAKSFSFLSLSKSLLILLKLLYHKGIK